MLKTYIRILVAAVAAGLFVCCERSDRNADRGEYIEVYASPDSLSPLEEVWLPCSGGSTTLYVRSNVTFEVKWQDGILPAWASVSAPQAEGDDLYSVRIDYNPLSERQPETTVRGLYERRDGVLMLTNAGIYLGRYFVIHQGFTKRVGTDFSWLTDGYDIPNKAIGESLYEDWTSYQKAFGFSSTLFDGQEAAWCYAKKGYVRLGNEDGMGADLLMPSSTSFAYDSLLVLSFAAVAQTGATLGDFTGNTDSGLTPEDEPLPPGEGGGTEPITPMSCAGAAEDSLQSAGPDASLLRVEISGGGFFRTADGAESSYVDLEVGHYNQASPGYPADIFDGQRYLLFIEGGQGNELTGQTTVRFVAGDVTGASTTPNRIYLDDLYIYRILGDDKDENLYQLNGRVSGRDNVLGGARNE